MTLEAYVIGSILLGVIVVAVVALVHLPLDPYLPQDPPYNEVFKCPRCGAMMQVFGGGTEWRFVYHVVPPPLVRTCPLCGYSERLWA
jgi:hypothetical protein